MTLRPILPEHIAPFDPIPSHFADRWAERGEGLDGAKLIAFLKTAILHRDDRFVEPVRKVHESTAYRFLTEAGAFYAITGPDMIIRTVLTQQQWRYTREMAKGNTVKGQRSRSQSRRLSHAMNQYRHNQRAAT